MKDLYDKICRFRDETSSLRKELLSAIKEFVKEHGIPKENKTLALTFDADLYEILDPLTLVVEVDRHTGDLGSETLDAIIFDTEKDSLCFETDSYISMENEPSLFEIMEIYEFLKYLDDNEYDDIEIGAGTVKPKED